MKTKRKQIKQQIIAVTVIAFMFIMIAGSFDVTELWAATTAGVNLFQNFITGGFGITATPNVVFNNITIGTAINSLGNLDSINVWDLRGTGAGWSCTGYSNNLAIATAGINNVSNASIYFSPGTITALQGSATSVAVGAALQALSVGNGAIFFNAAAASGMGNYRLSNTVINIVYNGRPDELAGSYAAGITLNLN